LADTLTTESFREALRQASAPRELSDQKGRVWSRWTTLIPGHFRCCAKCGKKIQTGYILEPHVTTAICPEHVHMRWI
jgi:hypothetical protein